MRRDAKNLFCVAMTIIVGGVRGFLNVQRRWRGTRVYTTGEPPAILEGAKNNIFGQCSVEQEHRSENFVDQPSRIRDGSFPPSANQLRSIRTTSPALLIKSGPGTGKTYTLASRVVYLISKEKCPPENMVIMSFSNRDAELLKAKALDLLFASGDSDKGNDPFTLTREETSDRLWSGTIHGFASNVIQAYGTAKRALRVISSKESEARFDRCLRLLIDERSHKGESGINKLRRARLMHRDALAEVRQSRSVLIHQVGRCVELWKESSMLPPPSVNNIQVRFHRPGDQTLHDSCMELASRLGITYNVALLAWAIFPDYQRLHMEQGTADPADLAPLAFQMLLSSPKQLFRLRSKLKHIILDEYQDISVSQHQLIRLIVRGIVDELTTRNETSKNPSSTNIPPVLTFPGRGERVVDPCPFDVPQLFCAGDGQQSIYGFRGAAPQLSVDGFREDFPQSVITQLETSFRLSDSSWSAAKSLFHNSTGNPATVVQTFKQSPIGQARARAILFESLNQCSSSIDIESLSDLLSEELVDELTNSIHIQGVWDSREEAKYIAGMIKRRAKERVSRITGFQHGNFTFVDPSEVAIIVRAANQLQLLREALANVGIPYSDKNTDIPPVIQSAPTMKPVVLLTMHSAKGEEFDDIYLPGWTEGVFPHPSAVSSNRVDEERRLAFVAISRSRHRVVITHAFVRRALQKGPRLGNKMVTMQVRPSRFLYELVPDGMHMTGDIVDNINAVELAEDDKHLPSITWDRSQGSKGMIAGTNLPEYFQKSYHAPEGFDPPSHPPLEAVSVKRQFPEPVTSTRPATKQPKKKKSMPDSNDDDDDTNAPTVLTPTNLTGSEIHQVLQNVNEILSGKRGSSTSSKKEFLSLLKSNFGFIKGKIDLYVFEDPVKQLDRLTLETFQSFVLDNAIVASTRPLSQSSALQIGLFLLYSLSINPCA